MNGRKDLTALTLSHDAVTPDDLGLMQDLILAAVNDAGRRVDAEVQRKMEGLTGGLKIPGLS
jgi:DNA-binding protein YbaB